MAVKKSDQTDQHPCCQGQVTKEKVIEVIKATERYDDDDARTCFWMFVEGLNGDHHKKSDVISVLNVMKDQRPAAHDRILSNASKVIKA